MLGVLQLGCSWVASPPGTPRLPVCPAAPPQRYAALMGERMDVQVGETATDLDGRFAT